MHMFRGWFQWSKWRLCYRRAKFWFVFFCGQKHSLLRIFVDKSFLFMVGSAFRVKRSTLEANILLKTKRWNGGVEVAETTVRRHLSCRFRRNGKMIGQVYQNWSRTWREINVFSRFEYQKFYVLYPFVTYLLTFLRTNYNRKWLWHLDRFRCLPKHHSKRPCNCWNKNWIWTTKPIHTDFKLVTTQFVSVLLLHNTPVIHRFDKPVYMVIHHIDPDNGDREDVVFNSELTRMFTLKFFAHH
jgi:hypothetical protein